LDASISTATGALPGLGHTLSLVRDPLGFLSRLPAQGDLVAIRLGSQRVVVVCDPKLTYQLLVEDRTFDKGGPLFDRIREVTGDNLVTCPHGQHRRLRRLCLTTAVICIPIPIVLIPAGGWPHNQNEAPTSRSPQAPASALAIVSA
jgi:hypothetical protein